MSWQATAWARTQKTGSPAAKVILLLLADLADENHSCFPGQDRLASDSEQSVKSVSRHLAALEEAGFIRRVPRYDGRGKRTSDRFFLAVDGPKSLPDRLSGSPSEPDPLPDNQGGDYRTPVSEEQPEDQPDPVVQVGGTSHRDARGDVAPPEKTIAPGLAALDRDEHGPLSPTCRAHAGLVDPPPCSRCADRREGYDVAQRRRAAARRRAESDAAIQADRAAKAAAVPADAVADVLAEARAAIRAAKAAQTAQEPPVEPAGGPVAAPEAPVAAGSPSGLGNDT